jgi:hypothetical protein
MGHTVRTLHTRATSGASGLWQTYRHRRYAILFYSLLLTFVVGPLDSALGLRANLLHLFLAINLLAAVPRFGVGRHAWSCCVSWWSPSWGGASWPGSTRRRSCRWIWRSGQRWSTVVIPAPVYVRAGSSGNPSVRCWLSARLYANGWSKAARASRWFAELLLPRGGVMPPRRIQTSRFE